MKKDLKYYLNLNYPIEVVKIKEEDGGGYQASIPMLGRFAFVGDGDSIEEALNNLEKVKKILFKKYIDQNIPIPEPEIEEEKKYSGRFVLRLPTELHRFLALEAKKNKTTLNQYCTYLLTRKSYLHNIQEELISLSEEIRDVFTRIKEIHYKIDHPKQSSSTINIEDFGNLNIYKRSA